MSVLGWILAGVLGAFYLGVGAMKVSTPREKLLANPQLGWVGDFTATQVKLIGATEVLGGIGVILPWLVNIAPVLTPIAAIGLAIVQVFAIRVHIRRGETRNLPLNVVLLLLAAAVAVIRFSQL